MKDSSFYIHNGTARDFVNVLKDEVLNHDCLNHKYLKKLNLGDFKNIDEVLKDWANQYSYYSSKFPDYIRSIIKNTNDRNIVDPLKKNLDEELGDIKSDFKPHTKLFSDFKLGIGIDEQYMSKYPQSLTVKTWSELFYQKCNSANLSIAVGAISLGTEYIVPIIYPPIINCIEKHTSFDNNLSFFFRLHVECDSEHAEESLKIVEYLAKKNENREAIKFGTISALNLRKAFLDNQLARSFIL